MNSLPASLFILYLAVSLTYASTGHLWTYNGHNGPDHWHIDYPDCGGNKQSPINIDTKHVKYDEELTPFDLTELEDVDGVEMKLENLQGHTVEVVISGDTDMLVKEGGLEEPYQVKQFHFHWGKKDERGSEHEIDDKRYPMEMHIVLYSTKYDDFSDALDKPNGLAVLSFLFEVGDKKNEAFDHIISHFDKIEHSGDETEIPTFPIKDLLPEKTATYFRYAGSLTTPPCYESVVWSIFTNHIQLSEEQFEAFRHIKRNPAGTHDVYLTDDFRPLQDLNGRTVFTNDKDFE